MTRLLKLTTSLLIFQFWYCNPSKIRSDNEEILSPEQRSAYDFVKNKALTVVRTGFNAGDGYGEVWIRDYNTFIELSAEVYSPEVLKENLLVFFRLQGDDGNIVDGFIPKEKAVDSKIGYQYIHNALEPNYAGHKNTVETDQESSLIQAVYKYVQKTRDVSILNERIGTMTVANRMEAALQFLLDHRYNDTYGLLWGATTTDWGDVQPEHDWGVYLTEDTHYAIDIYDNAMFLIAMDNFMEMIPEKKTRWMKIHQTFKANAQNHLWDESNQKYIPHIYLKDSPFPPDWDETQVYYHGGTAVAIEAGLLNETQIKNSLDKMKANVQASGAGSIGLTLYPPYPEGYFKNKGMYPYGYQNGGDWTWFGARMIIQLVKNGMLEEAIENLQPMVDRVQKNDGFYEWYSVENEPRGSGTFRGSAGVLYKAITLIEEAVDVE